MKKIKKFLNNNIKTVVAFILGIIISGTGVYAATILFASNQVSYDNTSSGLTATNVQDAIDELYIKASKIDTYKDLQCPGCVYRKSTTIKYNSNASGADGTNNKLSSSEYTTDYTTLNRNNFLGHVIDSNGYILSSYACGINNGTFFCLRGADSNQNLLTYKPFHQENVNRMNKVFPGCNANTSVSSSDCYGDVHGIANANGYVNVNADFGGCYVSTDSTSSCY